MGRAVSSQPWQVHQLFFTDCVKYWHIPAGRSINVCKGWVFSLVPVPGYLPNSNDLEQKNADQIIQTASDEVNSISKRMQVIMQGDDKHPHINKSGSFLWLRSFELNDMGFQSKQNKPHHIQHQKSTNTCRLWYKKQSSNIYTKRKRSLTDEQRRSKPQLGSPWALREHLI